MEHYQRAAVRHADMTNPDGWWHLLFNVTWVFGLGPLAWQLRQKACECCLRITGCWQWVLVVFLNLLDMVSFIKFAPSTTLS